MHLEIDFDMTKKLFAKYPVPTVEELRTAMMSYPTKTEKSFDDRLDSYIKGRIGDIELSQEIILREKQRIKKAKKCIGTAEVLMSKNGSNKAKLITKKYYDDLLFDTISKVNSKFLY